MKKEYACVVNGAVIDPNECLKHWLKIVNNKPTIAFDVDATGLLEARLSYIPIAKIERATSNNISTQQQTAMLVQLDTGRKHQIRAQLAKIGHPIVGDGKYNASQIFKER